MFRTRRRRRQSNRALSAAFLGGVVAGLVVWSMQMQRCRRDLFSANAMKRLAALGYLGGHATLETAQILTEYVRWEKHGSLRRRAERLLGRVQRQLT